MNQSIPMKSTVELSLKKTTPLLRPEVFTGQSELKVNGESHSKESPYEKFIRSVMDQRHDYPLPEPVINLYQNGLTVPLLTRKSFSLWQGKQKSKKTTVLALAIASFIKKNPETSNIMFTGAMEGKAIFFDTEQGQSYGARTMKLILKIAEIESSPNLIYCDLREFSPTERIEIIRAGIEGTPNVALVVIDGLVDLLNDFMDAAEGHITIIDLQKLTSLHNIHVAGVLHQNKNDKNARAHIGTISSQKCEIQISTEVDPDDRSQSIVTCVDSRDIPFEPFAIRWDKGSLPCINQEWSSGSVVDKKASKNYERSQELAESIFKPLSALTYKDAVAGIMGATKKGLSTAKRLLEEFQKWQFIDKGQDGKYRILVKEGSGFMKVQNGSNEPVQQ